MPTKRFRKVRLMPASGLARVVRSEPFTVQLLYETTHYCQDVCLDVDAGSKVIGMSAKTKGEVLYEEEMTLVSDTPDKLSKRAELRRRRRAGLRYRPPRFDNRVSSKKKGWLPPSIRQKVQCHLGAVRRVCSFLPVKSITIEVARFDTQWMANPGLTGTDYQHGPQFGFWNTREYVLCRDGHEGEHCHGKTRDRRLNVHHIESRKTGGDGPDNLVTLCETCHGRYHRKEISLNLKRSFHPLRDAASMNAMRWDVYRGLREQWGDMVRITYGYYTKSMRIGASLPKSHHTDARCMDGNPLAATSGIVYLTRKVPCHTRSLHVMKPGKGGSRRSTIAPHKIGGSRFQRLDAVQWNGIEAFISGSTGGRPVLRDIYGNRVTEKASVNIKTITFRRPTEAGNPYSKGQR